MGAVENGNGWKRRARDKGRERERQGVHPYTYESVVFSPNAGRKVRHTNTILTFFKTGGLLCPHSVADHGPNLACWCMPTCRIFSWLAYAFASAGKKTQKIMIFNKFWKFKSSCAHPHWLITVKVWTPVLHAIFIWMCACLCHERINTTKIRQFWPNFQL